jgi:DEAD/DEAH box helicase domain-containing protein
MNYVVFDIETQNIFADVGSNDATDLDISVISVYEKDTDTVKSFTIEEFSEMWPIFERADALVGYNSEHFDTPLLNKYYHGDLNNFKSIDLLVYIRESLGKRPKLDNVAAGTLGKNKIAHGLEAVEWWKKGEIDKIKKYCEEDVMITKQIFEYALENKSLKVKSREGDRIVDVPIDTSSWEDTSDNAAVTKSLF